MSEAKNSHTKPLRTVWAAALLCGLLAGIVFSIWPELDLYSAALFYEGNGNFVLIGNPAGTIPRFLFRLFFIGFCALCLFGLFYTIFKKNTLLGFAIPHWAYLVACMAIGPGIITNTILKDHWGRARPIQTEQFGSSGKFTPALVPGSSCDHNCSFVSGEASSIFMVFFALALLLPAWRQALLAGGVIFGSLAGLVRMGMGGHFLSDVTFSGIFMLLTASALYWLVFTRTGRSA